MRMIPGVKFDTRHHFHPFLFRRFESCSCVIFILLLLFHPSIAISAAAIGAIAHRKLTLECLNRCRQKVLHSHDNIHQSTIGTTRCNSFRRPDTSYWSFGAPLSRHVIRSAGKLVSKRKSLWVSSSTLPASPSACGRCTRRR